MDTVAAEVATERPRRRGQQRDTQSKTKAPSNTKQQSASSLRKHKPHNPRSKSAAQVSRTAEEDAAADAAVGDYRASLWFTEGKGDLVFAQWLLGRCNGVGDHKTPQSVEATKRLYALFKTQRKLRRELALSSQKTSTSDEEGGEEVTAETEAEAAQDEQDEETLWPVEEIVEQVGNVLRPSRLELQRQQREAEKTNRRFEGGLERIVVAEVVDNATELILSRATSGHEELLRRWATILQEEAKEIREEEVESTKPEENNEVVEGQDVSPPTKSKKQERREKKARTRKSKSRLSEEVACEQVESFLVFLAESGLKQSHDQAAVATLPSEAEKLWTLELQQVVELSSIEPDEEERRLRIARDIQTVLRREISKWRHCEVVLFGSSLSHYGSRNSDLDMCLLPTGRHAGDSLEPPKEVMGSRQIRHLLNGKSGDDGNLPSSVAENVDQLLELRAQVQKSIEKLTQALNTLDQGEKKGDKHAKQQRHLVFFDSQMRLLRNAIMAELTALCGEAELQNGLTAPSKSTRIKTAIAASKRRSDDLYLLRAVLQRAAKCEIRHVIAGARVPIIRFLHTRSGREYECDLCFENVLATRNTMLLRAYAAFDDRARALGLAVKHWAKQRDISDAAMGFLSSYSFVILSIYYLQVVHVLPNLQDPQLLGRAQTAPEYYNGVNIAFCTDRAIARIFHQEQTSSTNDATKMSLTTLLTGFFEYYATHFDFAKHVVLVRSPETPTLKIAHWGSRKAKTWRMSIQDPLETSRDLGVVLQFKGQEKIISELRRAHEMLLRGESFANDVCAVEQIPLKTNNAGKAGGKPKQGAQLESQKRVEDSSVTSAERRTPNDEPGKRSYVVILRSADQELTKEVIISLFKEFEKSFRVGQVIVLPPDDRSGNLVEDKNNLWQTTAVAVCGFITTPCMLHHPVESVCPRNTQLEAARWKSLIEPMVPMMVTQMKEEIRGMIAS
ncbi:Zinc finger, CCHC domain-containing protein [Phytophthora boehmeriae]|uniref:Zinc finger, CCHC domain-containing protein n=1 Tax=Phytophthora boehmeriae TaxID=109152 RepID=A0A8T1X6M4_9STRA|nr:Zinc finger, CCHC domain-containing protein [Phytophthora boehmeriae]